MKKILFLTTIFSLVMSTGLAIGANLTLMEELGKKLFFDENLSANEKMSCATCHAPEVGFTGPDEYINLMTAIYPGTLGTRFGNRKPPAAAYAGNSPILYDNIGTWTGGMFWDGRATGWTLGDPLAEQAQGPFLNPLEQALPNAATVCQKVANSSYAALYMDAFGIPVDFTNNVEGTYENIARAIAAYERSSEVNPFSSKYDYFLKKQVKLNKIEKKGLRLFEGKGMCSNCHPSSLGENGEPPLFTDFTYDNLGVPKNPNNPFYNMPSKWNPDGTDWIDPGLGGFLNDPNEWGKHKVPTLRNVDKRPHPNFVKAYAHNGVFKSIEEVVHFYNTRDIENWPAPEVAANMNTDELGNLGLTPEEEEAIVAFLKTLSDGYTP